MMLMPRAAKTAKTKTTKARVRRSLTIALNPAKLTQDEVDCLVCLQRRDEKRIPLEQVMTKAGLRVAR